MEIPAAAGGGVRAGGALLFGVGGALCFFGDGIFDLIMSGVRGTILMPDFIKLSIWLGSLKSDSGDGKDSEESLEGVASWERRCNGDEESLGGVAS